jgi:hypothetical protein
MFNAFFLAIGSLLSRPPGRLLVTRWFDLTSRRHLTTALARTQDADDSSRESSTMIAMEPRKTLPTSRPDSTRPRRRRRRRLIVLAALLLAGIVALVGPWPMDGGNYAGAAYTRRTLARIALGPPVASSGPLLAGYGDVEITPAEGEPLAGYSAREPMAALAGTERLYARAISVRAGAQTVSIVGGDLLAVMEELRDAVLRRTGLPRDELFFTASHTHCGPGGYSSRRVERVVLGEFDQALQGRLADALARAVELSRTRLAKARLVVTRIGSDGGVATPFVRNRFEPGARAHETIVSAVFWPDEQPGHGSPPIATLVVASAHPTCYDEARRQPSGDYPGALDKLYEARFARGLLFAAGAVGSMGPWQGAPPGGPRAQAVARELWARLVRGGAFRRAQATRTATLASWPIQVDLPPVQVRLGGGLRLSPLVGSVLHDGQAAVHLLRVGELTLAGMPGDYSGELAMNLSRRADAAGIQAPTVTSFNGDYIGYLLPRRRFAEDHYESRTMSFFGPGCGEYVTETAFAGIKALTAGPSTGPGTPSGPGAGVSGKQNSP